MQHSTALTTSAAGGGGGYGNTTQSNASTFQRNKQIYLELESNLQRQVSNREFRAHFQAWMDATIAELDKQFDACETSLSDLQQGVYVGEGQYWTPKTLAHHCNLAIDERRLLARGQPTKEHATWPELVLLLHTLSSLRGRAGLTEEQKKFIENVEDEFKTVSFERREVTTLTQGLTTKLSHDIESHLAVVDTEAFQRDIDAIAPQVIELENELEAALLNGDMAVAEGISLKQMELHEHLLRLVCAQYPVIHRMFVGTQNFLRKRRWAIFRLANKDISCVVEAKMRQMEACREDMRRIEEQVVQYTQDDKSQRLRYEIDKAESNKFLADNKTRQEGVWNKISMLFKELCDSQDELANLADARRNEVERRLRVEEREAGRSAGHRGFLNVAEKYMQWLQDTLDNAQAACDIARALNEFVLDGCDNVTAQFDQQQQALEEVLWLVQRAHYKYYTDFMVAGGRLQYHKERLLDRLGDDIDQAQMLCELATETLDPIAKKHADSRKDLISRRRTVQEEINSVAQRMRKAEEDVKPAVRAMQHKGVRYTDPREMLERMNLERLDKVLTYREEKVDHTEAEIQNEVSDVLLCRAALETQKAAPTPKPPGTIAGIRGDGSDSFASQGGPYQRYRILEKVKMPTETAALSTAVVKPQLSQSQQQGLDELMTHLSPAGGAGQQQQNHQPGEIKYSSAKTTSQNPLLVGATGANIEAPRASGYVGRGGSPPSAGQITSAAQALSTMRQVSSVAPGLSTSKQQQQGGTLSQNVFGSPQQQQSSSSSADPSSPGSAKFPSINDGQTVIALFPYRARAPDELSFERNDTIICIGAADEGWCNGVCNQRVGLFPTNFVQAIE